MKWTTVAAIAAVLNVHAWAQTSPVKTVFLMVFENKDWSSIKGNPAAPYINDQLLPMASHAENYQGLNGVHPSLPNYIWLEAGSSLGVSSDAPPSQYPLSGDHLTAQLEKAGISWRSYQEDISGTACPLTSAGTYTTDHDPMVYFADVTNGQQSNSITCISHVRPYSEFADDLANNSVARYNFISPNLCHSMHDCGVDAGDAWLSTEVPKILASAAYKNGGLLLITFDESEADNKPIGLIAVSPVAKGNGYSNTIQYTHSSTLRTIEEIFGVSFLGGAGSSNDLGDLFTASLAGTAPGAAITSAGAFSLGSVAPGEIVTVFGPGIGPSTAAIGSVDGSGKLGTSLGGTTVMFNDTAAPLLYAGANQVNVVVPYELAGHPTAQIAIQRQGQNPLTLDTLVANTMPSLFTFGENGTGQAAALNLDMTMNSSSNPAARGSVVALFGSGAGALTTSTPDGQVATSNGWSPAAKVTATVGSIPAPVTFAGSAKGFVSGAVQINVQIPDNAPTGASVPVMVTIGTASTQFGVTIAV